MMLQQLQRISFSAAVPLESKVTPEWEFHRVLLGTSRHKRVVIPRDRAERALNSIKSLKRTISNYFTIKRRTLGGAEGARGANTTELLCGVFLFTVSD